MTAQLQTTASIEANRKRYEDLKAAGNSAPRRVLPGPTPRDGAQMRAADILHRETIPANWYWTTKIARGQGLRLLNSSGTPGVSLFCWNAADPSERYNSADTIKIQWTAEMRKGRVLFSDMGRVLLSIVEDTCCAHDTVAGGSTPASNLARYGDGALRSSAENFVLAAGKHGLSRRDLAPVITFFAPVTVGADGRLGWRDGRVAAGDFVDLRAELDLIVAISNCPHPLSGAPTASGDIEAVVHRLPAAGADDLCRTASAEAARGFDNNALYLRA